MSSSADNFETVIIEMALTGAVQSWSAEVPAGATPKWIKENLSYLNLEFVDSGYKHAEFVGVDFIER